MKSQLEKWESKWKKSTNDSHAERLNSIKNKDKLEGEKELMSEGNIKEAAVVFSHEGMKAFSRMFGNSMENVVSKAVNEQMSNIVEQMGSKMESIIEAKMLEMLQGMTEGMAKMADGTLEKQMENIKEQVKEEIVHPKKVKPEPIPVEEVKEPKSYTINKQPEAQVEVKKPEGKPNRTAYSSSNTNVTPSSRHKPKISVNYKKNDTLEMRHKSYGVKAEEVKELEPYVLDVFKANEGSELTPTSIFNELKKHYGIKHTNPTLVLQKIIQSNPNIQKVGFGLYVYEEKNFKPTI